MGYNLKNARNEKNILKSIKMAKFQVPSIIIKSKLYVSLNFWKI